MMIQLNNNILKMKSYADQLWDKIQLVIKQSNDRRKQIQQFIYAVTKRIEAQETYARSIESVGKIVEKYIQQKSTTSFTYSAFKSNHMHRAQQSRVFAQSLKDQVLIMLRDLLNAQNNQCRKLQKDSRKYEKDMQTYVENLNKAKQRFIMMDKEREQHFILNEISKLSNELTTEKKQKQNYKTKEVDKETRQYEATYRFAMKQYNEFLQIYYNEMGGILKKYQQHETIRIDKQVDTIMKILVFETSMMRNFDYDITNISGQMEAVKPETDIFSFIDENCSRRPKFTYQTAYSNPSLLNTTVYKIVNKQLDQKMEFEKNKQIKAFIDRKYKGQDVKELRDFKQTELLDFNKSFDLVTFSWKSNEIGTQQLDLLKQLIQKDYNRHMFLLAFRHFGSMYNLQIPNKCYQTGSKMLEILLQKCYERKDVFVARKIMNIMFSFWTSNAEEKKQQKVNPRKSEIFTVKKQKKILLYIKLMHLPIWKANDYWQAAIFESIHQELKSANNSQKGETIQQSIIREKNIIFSQLASFCHNMIMLSINPKTVRVTVGKYCRYYDLDEQKNKDLSQTINNAHKQYKETNKLLMKQQKIEKVQKEKQKQREQFRPMMM